MVLQQFRVRHSAERGPPQLRFKALLVDSIYEGFHIRVTVRKLLGIESPIPHIVLPTVVQRDPGESQSLDCRQRVVNLLWLNGSAIAPCAPDGAEGAVGRRGHLEALLHHETAIVQQSTEVVSLMDGSESAKCMKTFSGSERLVVAEMHGNPSVGRIRHRHR